MKTNLSKWIAVGAAAALLTGCGGGDADGPTVTRPAAVEAPTPVTSITITGNDRMQFDPTEFVVEAGTEITVTFRNIGSMPKETMGHNLAFLDGTVDPIAFANAALRYADNEFIPSQYEDRVIAATKVLGPGEEEVLVFTAPEEAGEYPFVCSFTGHTQAGMRGIMTVQ